MDALHCRQPKCDARETYANTLCMIVPYNVYDCSNFITQLFLKLIIMEETNIYDILVSGTILVYGIWNMVCGIWYENGIHSVFAYVSRASRSGCLQRSASIPCLFSTFIIKTISSLSCVITIIWVFITLMASKFAIV